MSSIFDRARQSERTDSGRVQSVATAGGDMTATAAGFTHYDDNICPVCKQEMPKVMGFENQPLFYCEAHGIALPVPA